MLILLSFVPFTMCQCCSVLNAFLRYGFLPLFRLSSLESLRGFTKHILLSYISPRYIYLYIHKKYTIMVGFVTYGKKMLMVSWNGCWRRMVMSQSASALTYVLRMPSTLLSDAR